MSQVDYGKALRVARAARGMNKRDLARAAGVSPTYVGYLEKGERHLSLDALERLSAALNLPVWAIVCLGTIGGGSTHAQPSIAVEAEVIRLLKGVQERHEGAGGAGSG